ncbi:methyltransferase [Synechocystis sp. PCC 7509]|uniref:methyltransferase n=1 Tax=Synechocystis sp. PCC 7509 TaxID=927677 RepID=UPI0002ACA888|nr:methyltransferase [Synechocystis sp. PCC 7509]
MIATTTQNPTTSLPLPETLMQMITGGWVSQAIYVAAKLGIADLLKDGSKSSEELATLTNVDANSLYRILRALSSLGIFSEGDNRYFELTPMAEYLRSDIPESLNAVAVMMGGEPWHWQPWGDILYSVKTGKPAFDHVFKMSVFPYLGENPEAAAIFDSCMTSLTTRDSVEIVANYDFSSIHTLVDVGGGHGKLLAYILESNPNLQGILYDLPAVVVGASPHLDKFSNRTSIVSGSFFESVPNGGDAYIMKHIIHDWDDEKATSILKNCHQVMPANGKLLVVEDVLPPANQPSMGKLLDLEMLLMTNGGRERTETEFNELFAAAGFKLTRIVPSGMAANVIEGVKA